MLGTCSQTRRIRYSRQCWLTGFRVHSVSLLVPRLASAIGGKQRIEPISWRVTGLCVVLSEQAEAH